MSDQNPSAFIHEQVISENQQVAIAMRPRKMGPLLQGRFPLTLDRTAKPGGAGPAYPCNILDTKYEPGSYLTILYQVGEDLVIGAYRWDSEPDRVPMSTTVIPSLGMQVYRFPDDPALPNLVKALDSRAVCDALGQALPEFSPGAARILRCRVEPLRFRPGRRCTLRLSLWVRQKPSGAIVHRVLYGKIYHDLEKAGRVHQQMRSLSELTSIRKDHVSVAPASAFLPDLSMVLQQPVEGVPLDSFISPRTRSCHPRGLSGVIAAGSALAALHSNGLDAGKPRSIASELERFQKRGAGIGRIDPQLGGDVIQLAQALSAWLAMLDRWGARIALVHGDCKPSQFLINGPAVALLDFDHCGMADPAVDVGTFLATLQQMQVQETVKHRGQLAPCAVWLPGLKQRFLAAYCATSGDPPAFWYRASWYEAVGLLRKAIRAFERSPFSPLPAALVAEARQVMATLPSPLQS